MTDSNFKDLLPESRRVVLEMAANHLLSNPRLYKEFISYSLIDKTAFNTRAAYVLTYCHEIDPGLFKPFASEIIKALPIIKIDGIKRSYLKILTTVKIKNTDDVGFLIDHCFKFLNSAKETVGVKIYCAEIIFNHTVLYPDLIPELVATLEQQMKQSQPAIVSRGNKILKQLRNKKSGKTRL